MSRRKWRGLLASSACVVALAVVVDGCSSSSNAMNDGGGGDDSGVAQESSHPPVRHPDASFDSGITSPGDGGGDAAAVDGTTGQPCMMDAECSPTGLGLNKCSAANFFTGGPIMPTPVCLSNVACDPGTDNLIHYCDGPDMPSSPGICLPTRQGGLCLPKCSILSDGSPPAGCQGKDTCNVLGSGILTSGAPFSVGFCFGGCSADADCPGGSHCQKDEGVCLTTLLTRTKQTGQTCSANDPTGTCNCFRNPTSMVGYCAPFCITGPTSASPCPAGYVCDAGLLAQITNPRTDATVSGFMSQNAGLAGTCLQVCSTSDGGSTSGSDAGDAGGDAATGDAAAPAGAACPVTANCSMMSVAGAVCTP
jgi:hypothetical protein